MHWRLMAVRIRTLAGALAAACIILMPVRAAQLRADVHTWASAVDGLFSDGTMWTPPEPPGPLDDARFIVPGTYAVTFSAPATNRTLTVTTSAVTFVGSPGHPAYTLSNDLWINGAGHLNVSGGSVDVGNMLRLWSGGRLNLSGGHVTARTLQNSGGVLNFTGGALTVDGGSFNPGSSSLILDGPEDPTLNLINGATANLPGGLTVGNVESGTLGLGNGGNINTGTGIIGNNDRSTGVVTVDDAMWVSTSTVFVGRWGNGTLAISNGGQVTCVNGEIASTGPSAGVVTVQDAGSSWTTTNSLYVGGGMGGGQLKVSGGSVDVANMLSLRPNGTLNLSGGHVTTRMLQNSGGTFNFTGGALTVDGGVFSPGSPGLVLDGAGNPTLNLLNGATASFAEDVTVGQTESGVLNVNGGSIAAGGMLKLWSGGTLNVSGGQVTTGSLDNTAGGTFSFTGGGLTVDGGTFDPGTDSLVLDGAGNPTLNLVDGAQASFPGSLTVGNDRRGTLNLSSGGRVSSSVGVIRSMAVLSQGTVSVQDAGSSWTNTGSVYVGGSESDGDGTGALNVSGGSVAVGDTLKLWPGGTLSVSGGQVTVGSLDNTGGTFGFTGGALTVDGGPFSPGSNSLVLDGPGNPTLNLINGAVAEFAGAAGDLTVAMTASGTLDLRDGGQVTCMNGVIARSGSSTGTVTVQDAGSSWTITDSLYVGGWQGGGSGTGRLNVSGGAVDVANMLRLWTNGTLNLTGGHVTTRTLQNSGGTFGFHGGALTVDGGSFNPGSSSLVLDGHEDPTLGLINGATANLPNGLTVGNHHSGTLNVSGGGTITTSGGIIGGSNMSTGVVTVDGGTWRSTTTVRIGQLGNGTLAISNGGQVSCIYGEIAYSGPSTGAVTVQDAGSSWTITNSLSVGGGQGSPGGTGELNVSGGSVSVANMLNLWRNGTLNLSGGHVTTRMLRNMNGGTFNFTGGALTVDGGPFSPDWTSLVLDGAGNPTLNLINGATAGTSGDVVIGQTESGTLNVNGGSIVVSRTLKLWSGGTLNVSGGQVTAESLDNTGGGAFGFTGGALTVDGGTFAPGTSSLVLDGSANPTLNLVNGASAGFADDVIVGQTGSGTLNVNGGSITVGRTLKLWPGGTLSLSGGQVTTKSLDNAAGGTFGFTGGVLTVDGGQLNSGSSSLILDGPGTPTLNLIGGASAEFAGEVTVGNTESGILNVRGASRIRSSAGYIGFDVGSAGVVSVQEAGASWTNTGSLYIGGSDIAAGGPGLLSIGPEGLVSVGDDLAVWPAGTLNIVGGTIRFAKAKPATEASGTVACYAGTVEFDCDVAIGAAGSSVPVFFGDSPRISAAQHLVVTGQAMLLTPMTLSGGTFSTGSLVNATLLQFDSGTLNLTANGLTVGPGGILGQSVAVASGKTINVTGTATVSPTGRLLIAGGTFSVGELANTGRTEMSGAAVLGGTTLTNHAVLSGTGQVDARLDNRAAGQVQVSAGQRMVFTGAGNINAGQIRAVGGQVEFARNLTNAASTGMITGRDAMLTFTGGLANAGSLALSFGTSDIFGDVGNNATGRIVLSGGSDTTFYGDLVNDGTVQVSAGARAVYFGAVSGSGSFTGTGTNYFEGDLSPAPLPAGVGFGGDVVFGASSNLQVALTGRTLAKVVPAGATLIHPNATLDITISGGGNEFSAGTYVLIDAGGGSVAGTFTNVTDLGAYVSAGPNGDGLTYTADAVTLTLDMSLNPGDANFDGATDVSDRIIWNVNNFTFDTTFTTGDFNNDGVTDVSDRIIWNSNNFTLATCGPPGPVPVEAGEGGSTDVTTVPEPATVAVLCFGGMVIMARGRRRK